MTTTIRVPDDLATDRAGAALSAEFEDVAEQRYSRLVESGKTIPWSEMRSRLEARIAGGLQWASDGSWLSDGNDH